MSLPVDALRGRVAWPCCPGFGIEFYDCLYTRADALFELTDAVLCADGPVTSLVELSLAAEHRRGHGALYDGAEPRAAGDARLRRALAGLPLPRAADGRIVLAVDVSNWLRPDAPTSARAAVLPRLRARAAEHGPADPGLAVLVRRRAGDRPHVVDRACWTRSGSGPADDATAVTAAQLRDVVDRLIAAGHWRPGDPDILIVMDAGYDVTRLAHSCWPTCRSSWSGACARTGSCSATQAPPLRPARRAAPQARRRPRPSPSPTPGTAPTHATTTETTRYGTAEARGLGPDAPPPHPPRPLARPRRRTARPDGTLIRLQVEHLPGDRDPKPVWLWSSATGADAGRHRPLWQAFLRRFDLEHTFRLFKQTLGLDRPEDPRPPHRRPVDLADHRRPHPAPPRPPPRRRPAPPLGTAKAGAGSRPHASAGGSATSARQRSARPACLNPPDPAPDAPRLQKPPPSTPPRRRQDREKSRKPHRTPSPTTLKIKLRRSRVIRP